MAGYVTKGYLYRTHNKGTAEEYRDYYCYLLETKVVRHPRVLVSIMTEFVENGELSETGKQDCERKACARLIGQLKKQFPQLQSYDEKLFQPHYYWTELMFGLYSILVTHH